MLADRIAYDWAGRHGANPGPPFLNPSHEHIPIIIREGEFVQIVCDLSAPFEVWVQKNPDVDAVPGTPTDPFGWNGAHQAVVADGSVSAAVIIPPVNSSGNPTQPGPREQGFYKFRAIVYQPGQQPTLVDPDGYCDR